MEDKIRVNIVSPNSIMISSKSDFFSNEVRFKVYNDCIIFSIATIDDNVNVRKARKRKDGWYQFQILASDVPNGEYEFDKEDSDDDTKVIYF